MSEFVFKEGADGRLTFVGDFDGLYRAEPDPWGQSGAREDLAAYYAFSRQRLATLLAEHIGGAKGCRLEIGCGHGHVADLLSNAVGGHWSGLDISPAAVDQARLFYPYLAFHAGDIAGELPFPPSSVGKFDAVVLSQMLWYVLERLDQAIGNAARLVRPGGLLCVSQAFLRGEQRYGAEIADGFHGVLRLFLERYRGLELIEARHDDSGAHAHNDGLLIFRKAAHAE